ncbi:MAG: hypothetical protein E4G95_07825, partial [Bacteroidia bacterium]
MIKSVRTSRLIIIVLLLFVAAEVADIIYSSDIKYSLQTYALNRSILKKQKKGSGCLKNLYDNRYELDQVIERLSRNTSSGEYNVVHYRNNRLNLWTDNSFDIPVSPDSSYFTDPIINAGGRLMAASSFSDSTDLFICLVNIWNAYPIENDIIRPGFDESFGMPPGAGISTDPAIGEPIYGIEGDYLFSVTYDKSESFNTWFIVIPLLLWSIVVAMIVLLVNRMASWL